MSKYWLDMSKYQARRINPLTGNWDPANWDTSRIDFDRIVDAAEAVIIRIGDGLNLDPCFIRYRDALVKRGAAWGGYHLHRPNVPAILQVVFVTQHQPTRPPAGIWPDLEVDAGLRGEAYYNATNPYLMELDYHYDDVCGLYSARWFLDKVLPAHIQRRWAHRLGWWAGYPSLLIPAGWAEADPAYGLHQWTDRHIWPGLPNPADANARNPNVPLEAFMRDHLPTFPLGDVGTRIAIHAITTGETIPLIQKLAERGARVSALLAVEQAGMLMDAKKFSPLTTRILRLYTPQLDGLDHIDQWTIQHLLQAVADMVLYFTGRLGNLSPEERDAIDLLAVLNEADPETDTGWYNYGLVCKLLCEWATGIGLRLLLPGHNVGTPEYSEVVQFFASGLAEAMAQGGHALNVHEGLNPPHWFQNITPATVQLPGAPWPVKEAGYLSFRIQVTIDYLRRTGQPVPDIYVGEFYGGGYPGQDLADGLRNFRAYDQVIRRWPWIKAFHGFTMDAGAGWAGQDYNPLMTSPGMVEYIVQEREVANAPTPPPLPDVIAGGRMAQYLLTVSDSVDLGTLRQRIGAVDVLDVRVVVPVGNQPPPPAWYELWPIGVLNPARSLANPNKVLTFYKRDGTPFSPQPLRDAAGKPRPVTWVMQASEHVIVGGMDLLRVLDQEGTANDWYVRAVDVSPG